LFLDAAQKKKPINGHRRVSFAALFLSRLGRHEFSAGVFCGAGNGLFSTFRKYMAKKIILTVIGVLALVGLLAGTKILQFQTMFAREPISRRRRKR
jgi:hypothetical protein